MHKFLNQEYSDINDDDLLDLLDSVSSELKKRNKRLTAGMAPGVLKLQLQNAIDTLLKPQPTPTKPSGT